MSAIDNARAVLRELERDTYVGDEPEVRDVLRDLIAEHERTVQTAADLERLPVGTVVVTEQGGIWQAVIRDRFSLLWYEPGHSGQGARAADLSLPARILYMPTEHTDRSTK